MAPEWQDDSEGRNPNEPRRSPVPGDAGVTVTLTGGPLHGRDARLRDSDFRLWYLADREDRPTVMGARAQPALEPGQRVLGFYAFVEASESAEWHRTLNPGESFMTPLPAVPRVPHWFLLVIALSAIVGALALVVVARRDLPGRWVRMDESSVLDTQTGRICVYVERNHPATCLQALPTR